MQFKNNVNFNKKQLKNAVIDKLGTAPSNPVEGQVYFNDGSVTAGDKGFYIYQGTAWNKLTDQAMSDQQILDAVKRVDGTGSGIDADTIDGLESTAFYLATTTLNNITAPTANVALNGYSITGLKTEDVTSNTTNAATTEFVTRAVSNAIQGLDVKQSVKFATVSAFPGWSYDSSGSGSINVSGDASTLTAVFDGQIVSVNDRVLVRHFTGGDATSNGIYVVTQASPNVTLTRTDFTQGQSIQPNAFTFVERGNTLADTGWVVSSNSGTVGTSAINVVQFSSAGIIEAGFGLTKSGNTLAVDPTLIARRFSGTIPAGNANTPITVSHLLNTTTPMVTIIEDSTNEIIYTTVTVSSPMEVQVTFADAVTNGQYRVVIIG